jgi:hypothetical protein
VNRNSISVVGSLIKYRDRPLMLCTTLLASYPPQPGSGVEVIGVDFDGLPDVETYGGVMWTEQTILVNGHMDGDRLVADRPPSSVVMTLAAG